MNQLIRDAVRSPPTKCIPVDCCFQCIKGKMRSGLGRMINTPNHKLLSCGRKKKNPIDSLNISSSLRTVSMRGNHSRMFGSSEHDLRYPCLTYIPNALDNLYCCLPILQCGAFFSAIIKWTNTCSFVSLLCWVGLYCSIILLEKIGLWG